MKNGTYNKILSLVVSCSILFLTVFGCIDENLSVCEKSITVTLRAANPDEEGAIHDVILYAFDSDGKLLESRQSAQNRKETFHCPATTQLTFTGWCNTANEWVDVTPLTPQSSTMAQGAVSLVSQSVLHPALTNVYYSPADLFLGTTTTHPATESEEVVLLANRMVAGMDITVRGLKVYAGFNDNDYYMMVGTTKNKIDFAGRYFGSNAQYMPAASFNSWGEYIAPTFNLYPSQEQGLYIRVFHNDTLLFETKTNNNGTPLQVAADRTLHVLITFSGIGIAVSVATSQWGETCQWEKIIR